MSERKSIFTLSLTSFFIGIIFLLNSQIDITGAIVGMGINNQKIHSLSLFFIIISAVLLLAESSSDLEKKIKLISSIDKDPALVRYAEQATENQRVQQEMNHLQIELIKCHTEAGLGYLGHIEGTNISYMRGRRGARLFFREIKGGYEIMGKAIGTGKKVNETAVIKKLKELYGN